MSSQEKSIPPCAFTAPFLTHHGDTSEAETLRFAGEILYRDRGAQLPREVPKDAEGLADFLDVATLRFTALAEELQGLVDWLAGADALVSDLLAPGEVETAFVYHHLADAGRHLSALVALLEEVERYEPNDVGAWLGPREAKGPERWRRRYPGPVGVYRDWIASMAAVMRRWAPITRQLAEATLPTLPDAKTRQLMMETDSESENVTLYHFRDTVIGDVLAHSIAELESIAGVSNLRQRDVHRQIDPEIWAPWEQGHDDV